MKYGLSDATRQKINEVLSQYPTIESATLYGSRATGTFQSGSDIDLALHGRSDLTFQTLLHIMNALDDLLLPYRIDLSLFHMIENRDLIEQIEQQGVCFYQRAKTAVLD